MKNFPKSLTLLSIPLLLSSCGTSFSYTFDSNSSNEFGSMSYEIFVREFYDHDGDGVGDLLGVNDKLPYLKDLGIKTIWLMPIHPTSSYHGYDVNDYKSVNPQYGTIADFDTLVANAKSMNIDIMLDMVFNHSGRGNEWFETSYAYYSQGVLDEDSYAHYYNWAETGGGTYHKYNDLYYEGAFDASMPDLNLDSIKVREEIDSICEFWIKDHGVKGFRLDACTYFYNKSVTKNKEFLKFVKDTTLKYDPNFYIVGEAWVDGSGYDVLDYYQEGSVDSFFNFWNRSGTGNQGSLVSMAKGALSANKFGDAIEEYETALKMNNSKGYSSYFLSNHDMDRVSKSFHGEYEQNGKVAASLYCLLPGTPFMYYGEEISLMGERGNEQSDRLRRLPMIWSKSDKTGECDPPERASNYEQVELGVNDQLKKGDSLVNHYKKVINVRNKLPFMKHGIFKNLTESLNSLEKGVLAYSITLNDEGAIFIHNFKDYAVTVDRIGSSVIDEIPTSGKKITVSEQKITLPAYSSIVVNL